MADEKKALTVGEAVETLSRITEHRGGEWELAVEVKPLGTSIGGTPRVNVTGIVSGFDWDDGIVFITLEEAVRPVDDMYNLQHGLFRNMSETLAWIESILRKDTSDAQKLAAISSQIAKGREKSKKRRAEHG